MTKNIGQSQQSQAGVVRQHLDWIEGQLAIGIRQESIIANWAAQGIHISLKNFRNELWRARKQKGGSKAVRKLLEGEKEIQPKSELVKAVESVEVDPVRVGSHNPQELNRIMRSKPDMVALAKAAKEAKKVKNKLN